MYDYLIRSSALEGAAELVDSFDVDASRLFAAAGIPARALKDPDALVPYRAYANFLQLAAHDCGTEHFGLLLARKRSLTVMGLVWSVMCKTPDIRSALEMLMRYLRHHNEGAVVGLQIDGRRACLSYTPKTSGEQSTRQEVDLSCGFGARFLEVLCGDKWKPISMHFVHSAPVDVRPYRQLFKCPVDFDQEFNGAVFDVGILDIPLTDNDERVVTVLSEYLDSSMPDTDDAYIERVKGIIRTSMLTGDCCIDTVARNLSTSRRSLQRGLEQHGLTFKALLDEVRFAEATRFLAESRISMNQLADMLAYSDLSSFSRAFKQRFGQSPRQWQANNRSNSPGGGHA